MVPVSWPDLDYWPEQTVDEPPIEVQSLWIRFEQPESIGAFLDHVGLPKLPCDLLHQHFCTAKTESYRLYPNSGH